MIKKRQIRRTHSKIYEGSERDQTSSVAKHDLRAECARRFSHSLQTCSICYDGLRNGKPAKELMAPVGTDARRATNVLPPMELEFVSMRAMLPRTVFCLGWVLVIMFDDV